MSPKIITGYVAVSEEMLEDARRAQDAWRELEWIAAHQDEATDEQRAWLARVLDAAREREDEHDF